MKYLSLDVGEKRVGVAVSDEAGIIARPLLTLMMNEKFMEDLGKLISSEKPNRIIFGIPRHQSGEEGSESKKIREFAHAVNHEYNIEVDFEDESVTSIEAEKRMKDKGLSREEIKEKIDSEAACIILESYLERIN